MLGKINLHVGWPFTWFSYQLDHYPATLRYPAALTNMRFQSHLENIRWVWPLLTPRTWKRHGFVHPQPQITSELVTSPSVTGSTFHMCVYGYVYACVFSSPCGPLFKGIVSPDVRSSSHSHFSHLHPHELLPPTISSLFKYILPS